MLVCCFAWDCAGTCHAVSHKTVWVVVVLWQGHPLLGGIDAAVSMCCQSLLYALPALQQASPPTLFDDVWIRALTLIVRGLWGPR